MDNTRRLTFEELVQGLSLEEDVRERLLARREEGEKNFYETAIAFGRAFDELPEVERALGKLRELQSEGAEVHAKAPGVRQIRSVSSDLKHASYYPVRRGGRGEIATAQAPQAMFDMSKFMKEVDPGKMMEEFSKMLKQYNLPGVDMDALMASQKKNLEALTQANRIALEGMQAVAERQAKILQETMNEASTAVDVLSKAGSPSEVAAKQAELAKGAFGRALSNMRELAEMVAKSNQEATGKINERISATLDEIKDMALKMKQPGA